MRRKGLDRKKRERRRRRALRENAKGWIAAVDPQTIRQPEAQPTAGGIPAALEQERA